MDGAALADGVLSSTALVQIQALQAEKASFTSTEQKMDSQLIFAYKQSQNIPIANGMVPALKIAAKADGQGMVQVDIKGNITAALVKQIIKAGGTVINSYPSLNSLRASVPLSQIETIAASPDLKFIMPAVVGRPKSDPEGPVVHRADTARINFHVDGSPVKVGVLSDSVDFLSAAQATGDLGNVTVLSGQSGVPGTGEGTAMLEIVHSMAPGAQLFFATGDGGEANFAQNILNLRAAGCDIIVDDIGYSDESPFQDGIVAQAVNTVTAGGALYFSAAGNEGNLDSGTSDTWQGDFASGGAAGSPVNGKSGQVHSFGTQNFETITQPGEYSVLFWADPAGASTNDYDLYVLDSSGANIVGSSINVQNGTQDPVEFIGDSTATGQELVVVLASGAPRFLYTSTYRGQFSIGTSGNITGHATATNAFATAAVDVHTAYPNPFTGGRANPVEFFSSDGPRRVFFNVDGTPITPGNFSSTGGFVRQKPDIAAANGVTTTLPANSGLNPFYGTSAAAPHAAAIAALLKAYNPSLNPAQVRTILTNTALDIMAPGIDQDSGAGIVMALQALQASPLPIPEPNLLIVTNIISGGNGNGMIDYDECNFLDIILTNIGTTNATSVQATLSSTTPGVTIAAPVVAYSNLVVGAVGTNLTPFRVSTSPVFVCGTTINFVLVVKSDQITTTNIFSVATGTPDSAVRVDNTNTYAIPDDVPTGVSSPIVVSNVSAAIVHLSVILTITHPFDSDLTLQLIGPDGTTITLAHNIGGSAGNYGVDCTDADRTTFDDNGTLPIDLGIAPFIGIFQPEQTLSTFNGKSGNAINGIWQLHVVDGAPFDIGTIDCWSLVLTPAACVEGGGQCPGIDLALGMTATPNPDVVQSNLTYVMSVTNNGPDTAKSVALNQSLPNGVIFVSANASQGSVTLSGQTVSCNLGTIPVGSNAIVTVIVSPQVTGTLFSTASVGATEQDLNPLNNTVTVSSIITAPAADLAVTLTAGSNPVLLNGVETYIARVINNGPSPASSVVVTNILPISGGVLSVTTSQGNEFALGNVVVANVGTLLPGSNAIITMQVTPFVLGGFTAVSTVSSSVADPFPANNSTQVTVTVTAASDLSLKLTGPVSSVVGSNLTYQLTVLNSGPSAATDVIVKDSLPTSLTFISATSSQGISTNSGSIVSSVLGNLAVGSSATITIVANSAGLAGKVPITVTNTATVTADQADPNSANNGGSVATLITTPTVTVVSAGYLLQSQNFVPTNGMIEPGEKVTVLFRLQNLGNIDSGNVTATLTNSGGVTPNGLATQNYGVLGAGGAAVGEPFTFTVGGTNGGTITATFLIKNGGTNLSPINLIFNLANTNSFANTGNIVIPDHGPGSPYPSSNLVSGVTGLVGRVTVTLTNVNHTYPDDIDMLLVGPGGQSVLLMSHAGGGNNTGITNVSLTFDDRATAFLPTNTQIFSGTYAPSDYGSVSFPTNTPAPPYSTNLAIFNGTNPNGYWQLFVFDSSPGDAGIIVGGWSLGITAGSEVNPVVDLAVSGSASPSPVLEGSNVTYTFTITNNGPNVASTVAFTNLPPAGTTFVSATNSAHAVTGVDNNGAVYCILTNISSGSNVTVTVVVTPVNATTLSSFASVSGTDNDPNQSNNSINVKTAVNLPVADLAVSMTGPATGVATSNLVYSVTISNQGPQTALGVVLTDTLNGLTFVSGSGSPSASPSNVVCTVGNLAPGSNTTVMLVLAREGPPSTFTNVVAATTVSTDPILDNNSAQLVTVISAQAPVIIPAGVNLLTSLPNGSLVAGQSVQLSFQLANTGTAPTANLLATLLSGNGITSPGAAQNYGAVIQEGPAVARTFSFVVGNTSGGAITATLQLTDGTNNLGTVAFNFNLPTTNSFANTGTIIIPDHGPASPYPAIIPVSNVIGLVSKVTVTLSNLNHQFPNDVEVLLVAPSGESTILMAGVGGGHAISNTVITFDDAASASLPSSSLFASGLGQIVSGTYLPTDASLAAPFAYPAPTAPYGSTLSAFNGSNPNGNWTLYVLDNSPGDSGSIAQGWSLNLATVSPVDSASDLGVTLSAPANGAYAGSPFAYTVTVTNKGPASAGNVTLVVTLPSSLTVAGTSLTSGFTSSGNTVTLNAGTVAANTSTNFTLGVLSSVTGPVSVSATVSSDQIDLNTLDNSAQLSLLVSAAPQLAGSIGTGNTFTLTLTASPGTYNILASTNASLSLSNWTVVGTVVSSQGSVQFTDSNSTNYPYRYYRAVLVPTE